MARDKAKDDLHFNCSQQHETDYVAGLYPEKHKQDVKDLLSKACKENTLKNSTHKQVYALIELELGHKVP